ncbi:signal peptidase I SipW [Fictibacillus sp. 18YEL24]|uniref:signal peptidase I SipW n=1 Tax=Fictibacillus sp. 18YEL24 TaxID=2745875 RepID=UPI0018CED999|nr:signal peptidase I [Fictibacillus sp. 18YEL24]MBH0171234.1 signal peptidase I [Fictibacillus sp. 18YEL24]
MTKKLLKFTTKLASTSFIMLLCLLAFIILSSRVSGSEPSVFGYQIKAVLSGSMEPIFQTGSIISIKQADDTTTFKNGDIITFQMEDKLITHRIIDVENKKGQISYRTKGDNNDGPDMWSVPANDVIGSYSGFTVPYIGYALNVTQSKEASALLLFIPGFLLFSSAVFSIVKAARKLDVEKA